MERNKRILVVDDQQDLCDQLAKLLLRSGKKNETLSLVQQMRAKLLGNVNEAEDSEQTTEDSSYIVDTASQGEIAFEMIKKANVMNTPYAVAFIDMRMPPGWDGLKTAKSIREIDKDIEIVIMTAYADHDQKQIADTVGTPEKLLYIKKPFQAEEIYQLALSLTSKWSLEHSEKSRKKWLEILLKGICKVKSYTATEREHVFESTLKAMIEFTEAKGGALVRFDEEAGKWLRESVINLDSDSINKFVDANSARLRECNTIQRFEGKYLLPMRKDDYFAIVIIEGEKAHPDPEWYKLLCLFVMTAVEVLSSTAHMSEIFEKERQNAAIESANFICSVVREKAEKLLENTQALAKNPNNKEVSATLSKTALEILSDISKPEALLEQAKKS